jgi:hypothetical protein
MGEPLTSNLLPIDDDREPPIDDDAVECLAKVQAGSFAATPSTVEPFSEGAVLRWATTVPTGCRVGITLNGRPVARSGTLQVQPAATTRYTLSARAGRASRLLDSVTVRVDTSACISRVVPESLIRSEIRGAVTALDQQDQRFKQRSDPKVEVDAEGIDVALRLQLAIDDFADPNVDIDFTIGLRVRNGSVEPFYRRFAVDVDWPWWVTVITAGVSKIVEEFIDEKVEEVLKPRILEEVREQIDGLIDQLPGDLRLHTLHLAENEIRVTACPVGTQTPFMVLATAAAVGDDALG